MKSLLQLLRRTPPLVKKPSPIHGTGVFTTRDIKQGRIFYEIPIVDVRHEPAPRCAYLGNNIWVSDEQVLNYVNHSCNPNAFLDTNMSLLRIPHLYSLKPIKAGEEITVDYDRTEQGTKEVKCNCHSHLCRGQFYLRE